MRTARRETLRQSPPGSRPDGFTLVEILIAMGILSLVLAAIFSSWTAILRASRTGRDAAAAVQRARMAGRTIEESLGSAVLFTQNARYYSFLAENGDDPSLSFVARLAASFPRQGKFEGLDMRRVAFSVQESKDGVRELVLRQAPLLMEFDEDEQKHPLVLARGVKDFKTEFWDPRLEDWMDEWKLTNQLPMMVKVTLSLGDARFSEPKETVTRIVSLPSMAVSPMWQNPRLPPVPGQSAPIPGQPGVVPGQPGVIPGQPGVLPGRIPGRQGGAVQ